MLAYDIDTLALAAIVTAAMPYIIHFACWEARIRHLHETLAGSLTDIYLAAPETEKG